MKLEQKHIDLIKDALGVYGEAIATEVVAIANRQRAGESALALEKQKTATLTKQLDLERTKTADLTEQLKEYEKPPVVGAAPAEAPKSKKGDKADGKL
jgi:hypothetical protein